MASGTACVYGLVCAVDFDWPWCPRFPDERASDLRLTLGDLASFDAPPQSAYQPYARRESRVGVALPDVRINRVEDGDLCLHSLYSAEFILDLAAGEVFA